MQNKSVDDAVVATGYAIYMQAWSSVSLERAKVRQNSEVVATLSGEKLKALRAYKRTLERLRSHYGRCVTLANRLRAPTRLLRSRVAQVKQKAQLIEELTPIEKEGAELKKKLEILTWNLERETTKLRKALAAYKATVFYRAYGALPEPALQRVGRPSAAPPLAYTPDFKALEDEAGALEAVVEKARAAFRCVELGEDITIGLAVKRSA